MTLTGLAVRNLGRNPFRVVLTVAGVAVAILAFLVLRTVVWAWEAGAEYAAKDRVVTRHKVTFVMTLPKRYVDEVRMAPHIKTATWANWFGGKDPRHDREFFAALAVDAPTYLTVYSEVQVPPRSARDVDARSAGCSGGCGLGQEDGVEGRRQGHVAERHLPWRLAFHGGRHLHGVLQVVRSVEVTLPVELA